MPAETDSSTALAKAPFGLLDRWIGFWAAVFELVGALVWLGKDTACLLYTSPSPRDRQKSRMPSSA